MNVIMPVLLVPEKTSNRKGPPRCQIITVIVLIFAGVSVGGYLFYTTYIKKDICGSEECLKEALQILSSLDNTIKPCDDFFEFTCGNYLKGDGELGTGSQFSQQRISLENQINSLITDMDPLNEWELLEVEQKFYRSCRDTAAIDEDKNESLISVLNQTVGWPILQGPWNGSTFDLTTFLVSCHELGIYFERFFRISFNPEMTLFQLEPPSYLQDFENDMRTLIYQKLIVDTVTTLGGLEYTAEIEAEKIIEFEKSLYKIWTKYDSDLNQPLTVEEIRLVFPKVDIAFLMEKTMGVRMETEDVNITASNIDVLAEINLLLAGTPSRTLVNFVIWKFIADQNSFLANPLRDMFRSHYASNSAQESEIERRQICLKEVKMRFPKIAEIAWLKTAQINITSSLSFLLSNIRTVLTSRIKSAEYLPESARKEAIAKIRNLKEIEISLDDDILPKFLQTSENLNVTDNAFQMARQMNIFNFNLKVRLAIIFEKRFEDYDDNLLEEICITEKSIAIPAYFLQKYFYSSKRPSYLNYAAIGTQISKKIIQEVFSSMNETREIFGGILSNSITWVNQDVLDIFIRSKCAADDYVVSGIGELTPEILLENWLDLIGIDVGYEAYQNSLKKRSAVQYLPLLDYNPNQLFWIYYGRTHCSERGEEHNGVPLDYRLLNAVKNSRYFAKDFSCNPGSQMNPIRKCMII